MKMMTTRMMTTRMISLRVHYLGLGSAPLLMSWRRKPKRGPSITTTPGLITRLITYLYRTSPLDPFLKAARWIGRSQDPFTNFYAIFHAMLKDDEEGDDPEDEELEW
jgi:hypothetical protein